MVLEAGRQHEFGSAAAADSVEGTETVSVDRGIERRASCCQSGKSSFIARGSITAPDRICAPTSQPFSSTQTPTLLPVRCELLQPDRGGQAGGAAAHDHTSYSIDSRSGTAELLPNQRYRGANPAHHLPPGRCLVVIHTRNAHALLVMVVPALQSLDSIAAAASSLERPRC